MNIEKRIDALTVINEYKSIYQIDIGKLMEGVSSIELVEDPIFGHRFFQPDHIGGDSNFYNELSRFPWYYMTDKWEHKVALKYIHENSNVIEIGCAKGHFLLTLREKLNAKVFGIELNDDARKVLTKNNIRNSRESVEQYAQNNCGKFDVVCSFQVLEHIPNVKTFLDANISLLKYNGRLIICVPNNDSFIKWDNNPLNMPPHHMGLWNENALRNIAKCYGLTVENVEYEPLQDYHINLYYNIITNKYFSLFIRKVLEFTKIKILCLKLLKSFRHLIKGHSILIVFRK